MFLQFSLTIDVKLVDKDMCQYMSFRTFVRPLESLEEILQNLVRYLKL